MSSWARVGVKCVWVDVSKDPRFKVHHPRPSEPCVVKIIEVVSDPYDGTTCLLIEGYPNPRVAFSTKDYGWKVTRFRPIITKTHEEDVALFKSLLTGAPMGVEA